MKLDTRIEIGGNVLKLTSYDVSLRLSEAGTARFVVQAKTQPKGIVLFDAGYAKGIFHRVFIGYVEHAMEKSEKHWTVKAREICHALQVTCYVSLRKCTVTDVLTDLKRQTGLDFVSSISGTIPRFASKGDGYYVIRSVGESFGVQDYVWYQQRDGKVWLGSWADSEYAQMGNLAFDPKFYGDQHPESATLPALPNLRPGMVLNKKRLLGVRLRSYTTVVRWKN